MSLSLTMHNSTPTTAAAELRHAAPQRRQNHLLLAALKYASRGWPVLPLHTPEGLGCSCHKPDCSRIGKHPRVRHGVKDATTRPDVIERWWRMWPNANIGIATGPTSGLLVLDIDGIDAFKAFLYFEADHNIPWTLGVRTGRQNEDGLRVGWHFYFAWPAGRSIHETVGWLDKGIDVRGDGGYVIAPPSLHESLARYRWDDSPDDDIEALPDAVLEQMECEPSSVGSDRFSSIESDAWNTKLYRRAKAKRRDGESLEEVIAALKVMNRAAGDSRLAKAEIEFVAKNAFEIAAVGPDPVTRAWAKVVKEGVSDLYDQFISLAKHLQCLQPGRSILLPVKVVAEVMGCSRYTNSEDSSRFSSRISETARPHLD